MWVVVLVKIMLPQYEKFGESADWLHSDKMGQGWFFMPSSVQDGLADHQPMVDQTARTLEIGVTPAPRSNLKAAARQFSREHELQRGGQEKLSGRRLLLLE